MLPPSSRSSTGTWLEHPVRAARAAHHGNRGGRLHDLRDRAGPAAGPLTRRHPALRHQHPLATSPDGSTVYAAVSPASPARPAAPSSWMRRN